MKNEPPTCFNCRRYWGCRMSDNPRLCEMNDRPGCSRWEPKNEPKKENKHGN